MIAIGVIIMKMISWNVNGLRAVLKHDFETSFKALDADWFCLQETKMQAGQATLDLPGYHQYFNYAERKGYSGTAILTKHEPLNVTYGIGVPEFDTEGRVITLEYPKFYLITVYTPNSGSELKRLEFRQGWDAAFLAYTKALRPKSH
jgi:exodeoxyribonuclease-3